MKSLPQSVSPVASSGVAPIAPPIAPWAWVFDGVLWAVLLIAAVWIFPAVWEKGTPKQHLSFQLLDANAMIPGTNVYWMGVNVGAVDNVVLTPHAAEVSIDMHRNLPPIPWGTHVSVAFTGLGGNKEVQLLPPETLTTFDQPKKVVVEPSQRLKQVLQVNTDIAISLKQGADGLSNLLGKAAPNQSVAVLRHNIFKLDEASSRSHQWIQSTLPPLQHVQRAVHQQTNHAEANLEQLARGLSGLDGIKQRLKGTHPLQSSLSNLTKAETQLIHASDGANDLRTTLQSVQHGVTTAKSVIQPVLEDFNATPVPEEYSGNLPQL